MAQLERPWWHLKTCRCTLCDGGTNAEKRRAQLDREARENARNGHGPRLFGRTGGDMPLDAA